MVLYHYYQQQKTGDQTFNEFLRQNGVDIPSDFNGKLMTRYGGASNFSLSENLKMKASHLYGSRFNSGTYTINEKESTDVKDKYFSVHDKITYNYLNLENGSHEVNQIAAARAAYYEDHWYWYYDEGTVFTLNTDVTIDSSETLINKSNGIWRHTDKISIEAPLCFLALSSSSKVKAAAIEEEVVDETDTLHAFDNAAYMKLEEEEEEQSLNPASWDVDDMDGLEEYNKEDEKMPDAIDQEIERALDQANKTGQTIELEESDKKEIRQKMENMIRSLQEALNTNDGMNYLDVFHIEGNDDMKQKLLDATLPGLSRYFDVSAENINTITFYEAGATICFHGTGTSYSYDIRPAYDIESILVIWDASIEEYLYYEIDNEVIEKLGLTLDLRIPATVTENSGEITVRHYDNIYDLNLLKEYTLDIQGTGDDRYVRVEVNQCGPFELQEGNQSADVTVRVISQKDLDWTGTRGKLPAVKRLRVRTAKRSVLVSWKKLSKKKLRKFNKVEIQLCPDKKFARTNTIRKQVKKKKKSIRIKGLKRKMVYFVRVRNVRGSGTRKTVSKWTKIKRVNTK